MPKIAIKDGKVIDIVHRCKECPFVVMGTRVFNWTCAKTGKIVPSGLGGFGNFPDHCPLDDKPKEMQKKS